MLSDILFLLHFLQVSLSPSSPFLYFVSSFFLSLLPSRRFLSLSLFFSFSLTHTHQFTRVSRSGTLVVRWFDGPVEFEQSTRLVRETLYSSTCIRLVLVADGNCASLLISLSDCSRQSNRTILREFFFPQFVFKFDGTARTS